MKLPKSVRIALAFVSIVVGVFAVTSSPAGACRANGATGQLCP